MRRSAGFHPTGAKGRIEKRDLAANVLAKHSRRTPIGQVPVWDAGAIKDSQLQLPEGSQTGAAEKLRQLPPTDEHVGEGYLGAHSHLIVKFVEREVDSYLLDAVMETTLSQSDARFDPIVAIQNPKVLNFILGLNGRSTHVYDIIARWLDAIGEVPWKTFQKNHAAALARVLSNHSKLSVIKSSTEKTIAFAEHVEFVKYVLARYFVRAIACAVRNHTEAITLVLSNVLTTCDNTATNLHWATNENSVRKLAAEQAYFASLYADHIQSAHNEQDLASYQMNEFHAFVRKNESEIMQRLYLLSEAACHARNRVHEIIRVKENSDSDVGSDDEDNYATSKSTSSSDVEGTEDASITGSGSSESDTDADNNDADNNDTGNENNDDDDDHMDPMDPGFVKILRDSKNQFCYDAIEHDNQEFRLMESLLDHRTRLHKLLHVANDPKTYVSRASAESSASVIQVMERMINTLGPGRGTIHAKSLATVIYDAMSKTDQENALRALHQPVLDEILVLFSTSAFLAGSSLVQSVVRYNRVANPGAALLFDTNRIISVLGASKNPEIANDAIMSLPGKMLRDSITGFKTVPVVNLPSSSSIKVKLIRRTDNLSMNRAEEIRSTVLGQRPGISFFEKRSAFAGLVGADLVDSVISTITKDAANGSTRIIILNGQELVPRLSSKNNESSEATLDKFPSSQGFHCPQPQLLGAAHRPPGFAPSRGLVDYATGKSGFELEPQEFTFEFFANVMRYFRAFFTAANAIDFVSTLAERIRPTQSTDNESIPNDARYPTGGAYYTTAPTFKPGTNDLNLFFPPASQPNPIPPEQLNNPSAPVASSYSSSALQTFWGQYSGDVLPNQPRLLILFNMYARFLWMFEQFLRTDALQLPPSSTAKPSYQSTGVTYEEIRRAMNLNSTETDVLQTTVFETDVPVFVKFVRGIAVMNGHAAFTDADEARIQFVMFNLGRAFAFMRAQELLLELTNLEKLEAELNEKIRTLTANKEAAVTQETKDAFDTMIARREQQKVSFRSVIRRQVTNARTYHRIFVWLADVSTVSYRRQDMGTAFFSGNFARLYLLAPRWLMENAAETAVDIVSDIASDGIIEGVRYASTTMLSPEKSVVDSSMTDNSRAVSVVSNKTNKKSGETPTPAQPNSNPGGQQSPSDTKFSTQNQSLRVEQLVTMTFDVGGKNVVFGVNDGISEESAAQLKAAFDVAVTNLEALRSKSDSLETLTKLAGDSLRFPDSTDFRSVDTAVSLFMNKLMAKLLPDEIPEVRAPTDFALRAFFRIKFADAMASGNFAAAVENLKLVIRMADSAKMKKFLVDQFVSSVNSSPWYTGLKDWGNSTLTSGLQGLSSVLQSGSALLTSTLETFSNATPRAIPAVINAGTTLGSATVRTTTSVLAAGAEEAVRSRHTAFPSSSIDRVRSVTRQAAVGAVQVAASMTASALGFDAMWHRWLYRNAVSLTANIAYPGSNWPAARLVKKIVLPDINDITAGSYILDTIVPPNYLSPTTSALSQLSFQYATLSATMFKLTTAAVFYGVGKLCASFSGSTLIPLLVMVLIGFVLVVLYEWQMKPLLANFQNVDERSVRKQNLFNDPGVTLNAVEVLRRVKEQLNTVDQQQQAKRIINNRSAGPNMIAENEEESEEDEDVEEDENEEEQENREESEESQDGRDEGGKRTEFWGDIF